MNKITHKDCWNVFPKTYRKYGGEIAERNKNMRIIHKDCWGIWIFKRYTFILESEEESLTEIVVSKDVWDKYNVGDHYAK